MSEENPVNSMNFQIPGRSFVILNDPKTQRFAFVQKDCTMAETPWPEDEGKIAFFGGCGNGSGNGLGDGNGSSLGRGFSRG